MAKDAAMQAGQSYNDYTREMAQQTQPGGGLGPAPGGSGFTGRGEDDMVGLYGPGGSPDRSGRDFGGSMSFTEHGEKWGDEWGDDPRKYKTMRVWDSNPDGSNRLVRESRDIRNMSPSEVHRSRMRGEAPSKAKRKGGRRRKGRSKRDTMRNDRRGSSMEMRGRQAGGGRRSTGGRRWQARRDTGRGGRPARSRSGGEARPGYGGIEETTARTAGGDEMRCFCVSKEESPMGGGGMMGFGGGGGSLSFGMTDGGGEASGWGGDDSLSFGGTSPYGKPHESEDFGFGGF
jgi:hypothetical protein